MSEVKWIKLTTNVFDDEKFDAIKTLPDSNDIQLIWIKLLCLAGTCNENGFLVLTNEIPYTNEMLANRFRMDIGTVQRAMSIFQKLNMVEVIDNIYMVSNWLKYQSGDKLEDIKSKNNERQRRFREKQKQALLDNPDSESNVTCNVTDNVINNVNCSISYSISNSNVKNYKILIDNDIYENSRYIKDNNNLMNIIEEWMDYKDGRKPKANNQYTERGMNSLLNIIVKKCNEYGIQAVIETIQYTISNQWQGIVWDWMEKKYNKVLANENAGYDDSDFPFK